MISWLQIQIGHGEAPPRFYLPVNQNLTEQSWNCYFFLVAPFVLFGKIIHSVFRNVWWDLTRLPEIQLKLRSIKENENRKKDQTDLVQWLLHHDNEIVCLHPEIKIATEIVAMLEREGSSEVTVGEI